jgi:sugar phosphate isomerase/epimerase
MNDWAIGLSTGSFYRTSLFECLPDIRSHGFELVELCTYPAHVNIHDPAEMTRAADTLRSLGVRAASVHAPFGPHIDITAPGKERERSLREIHAAAQAAAVVGAGTLVLHPGPDREPSSEHRDEGRIAAGAATISEVVKTCGELGIRVALENQLPHLLTGGTGKLRRVLESLPLDGIGICLDTGHAHLSGDLLRTLDDLAPRLAVVHVSDNHGKRDDHLPPGEGSIDWRDFLASLVGTTFRGPLILELAGDGDFALTLEAAVRGRTFLESHLRALEGNGSGSRTGQPEAGL